MFQIGYYQELNPLFHDDRRVNYKANDADGFQANVTFNNPSASYSFQHR